MKSPNAILANQRGAVLVTGLMFLAILTVMGSTAYFTTTNELKMTRNFRLAKTAFYAADAGLEEARMRLKGAYNATNHIGDPAGEDPTAPGYPNYDRFWAAYLVSTPYLTANPSWQPGDGLHAAYSDGTYKEYVPTEGALPDLDAASSSPATENSLQSALAYWVRIKHKTEYEAEQAGHTTTNQLYFDYDGVPYDPSALKDASDPGSIIYYGYPTSSSTTPVQFTCCTGSFNTDNAYPVELITSYGSDNSGTQANEMEVVRALPPPITAALYSKNNVTVNGTGMQDKADGVDGCGSSASLPPIYFLNPATLTQTGNPQYDGNPPNPTAGTEDIDIQEIYDSLLDSASNPVLLTSDPGSQETWGDCSSDDYVTVVFDTGDPTETMTLSGQNEGCGVLLVNGNVTISGQALWQGIVVVLGNFDHRGNPDIEGAVLVNGTSRIRGNGNVTYESCYISNAINSASLSKLSWKQVR